MAHMSEFIAALPMYDWPEARSETDALWSGIRDLLRKQGIGAPEKLVRSNADMPPVKGGIRDAAGQLIAPDPAELPSDDLDMHVLWRHPKLLFAQACWGPMELGLAGHVRVVGQPDYSAFEGGQGELYSSAILMRRSGKGIGAPGEGGALIPRDLLRGKRLAFNSPDSMSGIIALTRDLAALGENPEIFRADRDRLPPGFGRRCGQRRGRCLRRRLPDLGSDPAFRASRRGSRSRRLDRATQGFALHLVAFRAAIFIWTRWTAARRSASWGDVQEGRALIEIASESAVKGHSVISGTRPRAPAFSI
jgi:hypothetical protein